MPKLPDKGLKPVERDKSGMPGSAVKQEENFLKKMLVDVLDFLPLRVVNYFERDSEALIKEGVRLSLSSSGKLF